MMHWSSNLAPRRVCAAHRHAVAYRSLRLSSRASPVPNCSETTPRLFHLSAGKEPNKRSHRVREHCHLVGVEGNANKNVWLRKQEAGFITLARSLDRRRTGRDEEVGEPEHAAALSNPKLELNQKELQDLKMSEEEVLLDEEEAEFEPVDTEMLATLGLTEEDLENMTAPELEEFIARLEKMRQPAEDELDDINSEQSLATAEEDAVERDMLLSPEPTIEDVARMAREQYGDKLPPEALSEEAYKVYERMYGTPSGKDEADFDEIDPDEGAQDRLYREDEDGYLEEIDISQSRTEKISNSELLDADAEPEADLARDDLSVTPPDERRYKMTRADGQLLQDIEAATQLNFDQTEEPASLEDLEAEDEPGVIPRTHPFTKLARAGTNPSTLTIPVASFSTPVSSMLAEVPNKHLDETAHRVFGGPGLPYGVACPAISRRLPQKPIPLSASQARMQDIEADVYMAAIAPGTYAAVTNILVELRRRLGSQWLEGLLRKEGGPRIFDAGGAGAAVLAWREVLQAEWRRIHETPKVFSADVAEGWSSLNDRLQNEPKPRSPPTPLGRATVLTASAALRERSSALLDNTTFIPRMPDYVHITDPDSTQRKQFDIVVAPHSLWQLAENWERKRRVQNLWSLLDPNGGVLVLLEKGVPRGFEVIAEARKHLLRDLFADEGPVSAAEQTERASEEAKAEQRERMPHIFKSHPGRILAPCTNQEQCPLYPHSGVSQARKDYCRFSQRYYRPQFLQRLLGAKARNFEDVEFSYVAIQKGLSFGTETTMTQGSTAIPNLRGEQATARAFEGYDVGDDDLPKTAAETLQGPTNILPRLVMPPLKRTGHVLLDVCTPSGTFERWPVPRSYGKQAYRDARKAQWGDLWALGAKSRQLRNCRLGRLSQPTRVDREVEEDEVGEAEGGDEEGKWQAGAGKVREIKGHGKKRERRSRKSEEDRAYANSVRMGRITSDDGRELDPAILDLIEDETRRQAERRARRTARNVEKAGQRPNKRRGKR